MSTLEQKAQRSERFAPLGVLGRARDRVSGLGIARQVLLLILLIYVAKQALTVAIFLPFSGHDEVAHYAYIRTIATEHRVPTIPNLEAFRQAISVQEEDLPGDFLPDDLYRYCRFVLDWDYCREERWANNPPHAVTVGGNTYPLGLAVSGQPSAALSPSYSPCVCGHGRPIAIL